jgi:hypothetical protein
MATKAVTILAMLSELVETHIEKCEQQAVENGEAIPHVISEAHKTKASIDTISTTGEQDTAHRMTLFLDDGTAFAITVEEV